MLEVRGVSAGYGDLEVLHDIDLTLNEGEVVAVVGSNGAGKSTLMRTLAGLIRPRRGSIEFDGRDITTIPAHTVAELGIVYVPEGRRLFGRLSVLDNLLVGSFARRTRSERAKNLELVFELFPVLKDRMQQRSGSLSGGEQQMLAIGRGLMACPKVLLLDEPSLGIAPVIVDRIFDTVRRLKAMGLPVLLSEQNVRRALQVGDRGMVIQTGRVVMTGTGTELLESDRIKRAYLGM